ncbi:uncharacterized protein LOC143037329 [Oratosquilla oratoria]|uniref:uncharacterized protein LOC143037329 n=1 Tax=Oratosquilla oratoria TaxID=337810 RepID=UPI003F76000B
MNKHDYNNKMLDILSDTKTYEMKPCGYAKSEGDKFAVTARKKKSKKGKKLLYLLEQAPKPPRMYGLPKIYKPGIPIHPITSGVNSASHNLARYLAKPLSKTLENIRGAHLWNPLDLIKRLQGIDFSGKKLASYDITSLFTRVSICDTLKAVERVVNNSNNEDLPVPKSDYLRLISLCVGYGAFTFNKKDYRQHPGLAMGSPFSAVLADLYLEVFETKEYMIFLVVLIDEHNHLPDWDNAVVLSKGSNKTEKDSRSSFHKC